MVWIVAKKAKFGVSTAPRAKPRKRPGRHTKSLNKHKKRQKKNNGRPWQYPKISYIVDMKEKIITLKVEGAATGQWSSLLLELNLMKQAWKSYGVDINIKASGLKNVLNHGTKVHDDTKKVRRNSN